MAHSLSARKRVRQNRRKRLSNKQIKNRLKTSIKGIQKLIDEYKGNEKNTKKDIGPLYSSLRRTFKVLDKAASDKVIHKNKAARIKGRLNRTIHKLSQA